MAEKNKKNKEYDIDFKRNLRMWYELAKPYKWHLIGLVLTVLVVATTRVADKFLFKVLIDDGAKYASGGLLANAFIKVLLILLVVYFSILVIKVVGNWIKLHIANRFSSNIMRDLKSKYFNHIIHLDYEFHTTNKTGSLISRLNRGSWALDGLTDFFIFNGAPLVLQLAVAAISVLYFDILSAVTVIIMSVLFISYSLILINKQRKLRVIANEAEDVEKANISDVFTNIDSIKYYGKEERVKKYFAKLIEDTKEKFKINWDYFRWLDSGHGIIIGLGLFFLIYFPLIRFLDGEISLGTLAFLYAVFATLAEPLFSFVWGVREYYESMANLQTLFDYSNFKNSIKDKSDAPDLKVKKGEIEFKNVDFAYFKKTRAVRDINLKINPNEKIALVGHSGCGKTTLIKLLYRFYDVNSGQILIDGKDIKDFKQESLRGELSIVPQEAVLFDDTIYNNVKFSDPGATRNEVIKAMKFAQLDKFVNNLPKKENTIVGERGVKLSGGEKQRVSIARAILANKKVLVLDEATSALDSQTEHEIQRDLEKLMKDRTSIIIAHRLSTIMKADKILVLDKGKIVQVGKHKDLIRKPGIYKQLWNLQKGGYIK
ncbi:hypothetical protein CMI47_00445 [Candidatus Pacearchaeota archaeon]|nr:hypothetical protein [Candidatus Pacearchaeota archaeon]|tara:strand:- start:1040 stop:2839 length:1800 start_codon:yes stop_codon:yes gene_type:complete